MKGLTVLSACCPTKLCASSQRLAYRGPWVQRSEFAACTNRCLPPEDMAVFAVALLSISAALSVSALRLLGGLNGRSHDGIKVVEVSVVLIVPEDKVAD